MVVVGRGMTPVKEAVWRHMSEKENVMKLKWFHKNQERLIADAEKKALRKGISPEILAEVEKMQQDRYRQIQRLKRKKETEMVFPEIDPHCIKDIMRPVDPETKKLLYTTKKQDGRKDYLNERYKVLPEDRYYFQEATSFAYGWHMFENMRNMIPEESHGQDHSIKNSFYRRNGALRNDPDYHRAPQALSPNVCGII